MPHILIGSPQGPHAPSQGNRGNLTLHKYSKSLPWVQPGTSSTSQDPKSPLGSPPPGLQTPHWGPPQDPSFCPPSTPNTPWDPSQDPKTPGMGSSTHSCPTGPRCLGRGGQGDVSPLGPPTPSPQPPPFPGSSFLPSTLKFPLPPPPPGGGELQVQCCPKEPRCLGGGGGRVTSPPCTRVTVTTRNRGTTDATTMGTIGDTWGDTAAS